jgi:hypothetical protein
MRARPAWLLAIAIALLNGCSGPQKPVAQASTGPIITQLYAPEPIPAGETGKICYGVENAKAVWISPPTQELSVAVARCIEVAPAGKTIYTLTVEGAGSKRVTQEITVGGSAAKARIVNVNISSDNVKAGERVIICYTVANARSVTIEPGGFRGGPEPKGCTNDLPRKSTTYTVTAIGADGNRDEERATVKVR